jgi:hypothetical protein
MVQVYVWQGWRGETNAHIFIVAPQAVPYQN